jgi:hypothetical protein
MVADCDALSRAEAIEWVEFAVEVRARFPTGRWTLDFLEDSQPEDALRPSGGRPVGDMGLSIERDCRDIV